MTSETGKNHLNYLYLRYFTKLFGISPSINNNVTVHTDSYRMNHTIFFEFKIQSVRVISHVILREVEFAMWEDRTPEGQLMQREDRTGGGAS